MGGTDEESEPSYNRNKKAQQVSAPNLALNLNGGSRAHDLYFSAIVGLLLQFGMLVFSGFAVYHPTFSSKFPKNGARVKPHAFPMMAAGTIVLMCGMLLCSVLIERSTEEKVYVARSDATTGTETTPKLRARILWLQKAHVVSDQTFDSFAIFGRNKNDKDTVDRILTSRRAESNEPSKSTISTGWLTPLGVTFGLVGFVLQFQVRMMLTERPFWARYMLTAMYVQGFAGSELVVIYCAIGLYYSDDRPARVGPTWSYCYTDCTKGARST